MASLDLFFRISNIALLALLAVVLIKNHPHRPSAILGALVALSTAGMAMVSIALKWGWSALEVPLNLLCTTAPLAFWLLSKSLFEDSFQWKWRYLVLYAVLVALAIVGHVLTFGDFRGYVHWVMHKDVAYHGLALLPFLLLVTLLVAMALYVALKDWRLDLVKSRRRARMVSVLLGGLLMLGVAFTEFLSLDSPRSSLVDAVVSGSFFVVIFAICARTFGFQRDQRVRPVPHVFPSEAPDEVDAEEGPQGALIVEKLKHLMMEDKIYREEGITIRRLAHELGVREHVLRRLINGHLGHRNFRSFLNLYRVEEVARQLVDPATRHLPVLSIALDNGYRSMSPFNKAFKEIKGMTPTEYRNQKHVEKY